MKASTSHSSLVASAQRNVLPAMIATTVELSGYQPLRSVGVVRGIGMHSMSFSKKVVTHLRGLLGGGLSHRAEVRERARKQAHDRMLKHAAALGANAIVGVRYEVVEHQSVLEVLCYGTAIVAEPLAA